MSLFKNKKTMILADQAIFSGIGFLLTILIARNLSVSAFGEYSAIILFAYLAISAISAWTIQVFQVAGDQSSHYISFIFWKQMILLLIVAIFIKISLTFFPIHYSNSALLFGMGFVMYDFSRKILLTLDKISATLLLDVVTSLSLLVSFLFFQNQSSNNINELLQYFAGIYLISLIFTTFIIKPFDFDKNKYSTFIFKHIKEGKWLFLTALSQWWAGNLFVVASGLYLGSAALGALRLGQSIFGILNVLLQTFENYVLPQTAHKMQQCHSIGIAYLKEMNIKLAYAFIPVLLFIFVFAETIITLAGGKNYVEYAFVLKGLSILYVFILLSQPIRFYFRSMQMNRYFFNAYFISLVFAMSTSHWLISTYGLQGVIAGLTGSQILLMSYWTIVLQIKNIKLWKSSTLC